MLIKNQEQDPVIMNNIIIRDSGIDVEDEFCRNDSFEAKSSLALSYCCAAAAAAAVPKRKLAGFDYLSMKMSDSE